MELNRPVWAEINLDNLEHNIKEVRRITKPDAIVTAVIKADGYGHGAVGITQTLLDNGADRLAVATLTEALQLRRVYENVDILVFGYTEEKSIHLAIENNITQAIYTIEQANAFNNIAHDLNTVLKIHIKLDTGMTRLGMIINDETVNNIEKVTKLEYLNIEGIYTHFAIADEVDKTFTHEQVSKFNYICDKLRERNINFPIEHVSNSAAIIDLGEYNFNMVRPGIMLYGLYPSSNVNHNDVALKEVMSLHAKVSRVQKFKGDIGVSYGHMYKTVGDRLIASLPIGYADGYSRGLSFKAEVIVKGKNVRVPVVGRICMDQCMIDVTGLDVKMGDEVILYGADADQVISIDEIADKLNTINYEVVCMISKRVPRVYKKNKEIVKVIDYIMEP